MYREGRLGNDAAKLLPVAIRDERLVEAVKVVEGFAVDFGDDRIKLAKECSHRGTAAPDISAALVDMGSPGLGWPNTKPSHGHSESHFCDPPTARIRAKTAACCVNTCRRETFPATQSELDQIALRLNQRPRKTLGFQTPASKLHASVAPTS
jgi:hypothetical protein